jgi:glycosyltransferase involved in cell wall biosynthesis
VSKLSVIIITRNEEENLGRCLASVSFADEIVVVDSHSTDRTADIAREHGCRLFVAEFSGFGAAKQMALDHATGDWILSIDADEAVPGQLREEIQGILKSESAHDGYELPRLTNFLGRWIRHCGWYPDYLLRLFKKKSGRFDQAVVHERVVLSGSIGRLQSDLLHYSYTNLESYFEKSNRYTTLGAQEAFRCGKRAGMTDLIIRPPLAFFKHYVHKRGFLDGPEGFVLSMLSAGAVLSKYVKLWHLGRKHHTLHDKI